ncbi:DUF1488 domain-containing protein [Aminobacter sp. NyZ550]|uniref:DUF1488 domain-containing protein n=2 Tax=Aminobacter TaxID=31988 RepID=A0AAC8YTC1_AMIAI|nr:MULTISPECIES: DUF1488 domain-containing protein [Aminobacter]AMS43221.1 hypothetical protein AA2016_4306 [Aminobacter aminovorans]MBA8905543.1 hypothetical protein [Aminobacter ciceronei]MBA9019158.1 hypothetical protein [Aminobacter ciceronei]MBB3706231.1 hypothetical protein [Aminobacter aminovorans]MRX37206.1 DUF1488 family protein [Aminobacter sp. MDW-2]
MTLAFLNPSRSFDQAKNAVRFIGHDGMFEVRFFVEAGALARAGACASGTQLSESECLTAFDVARKSIYDVAREAYSHGRRTYYTLTAVDFR